MTNIELAISVFIYIASLLLSQRGIAMAIPEAQEAGFAVAALLASAAAGAMYYRREDAAAPGSVKLSVGGVLAIAAIGVGMFTQVLWQAIAFPAITMPLAVIGTALVPFVVFPVVRKMFEGEQSEKVEPLNANHVIMAAAIALLGCGGALSIPAPTRSNVKLIGHDYPGVHAALPDWTPIEDNAFFDYGTIKLQDPAGFDRYMALYWSDGDPVQPDDHVRTVTGGQLTVIERTATSVSGDEAVTYFLQSPDKQKNAYTTIWNCRKDHRIFRLFSYLNGSKASIYATHQRVLDSIHCHMGGERPKTTNVYPGFIPPGGFKQNASSSGLLFLGPKMETILLEPGISGRKEIVSGDVPDEAIAAQIKQLAGLDALESKPTVNTTHDLLGHERRVWSAAGNTSAGVLIQVEVMVWYCDQRNMTFVAGYATKGAHPLQQGIDVLLPSACHEVK